MNNMKKILKEWKTFIKESIKDANATITRKENAILKIYKDAGEQPPSKREMMKIISPYFVSRILNFAERSHDDVFDFLKRYSKETIEALTGENFHDYYSLKKGGGLDFFKKKIDENMVTLIINEDALNADDVQFEDMEEMSYYLNLLIKMLENKDYDFKVLARRQVSKYVYTIKGGGASDVGLEVPTEWYDAEAETTPEGQRFIKALSNYMETFRTIRGTSPEALQKKYDATKEMMWAYGYLVDVYHRYGRNKDPQDRKMIKDFEIAAAEMKEYLDNHPRPEYTLDELMANARAGDKEAAKKARQMLVALGRKQEAREMRMLSR